MERKMPSATRIQDIVQEWNEGNLSRGNYLYDMFCCAEHYQVGLLLDAIPDDARREFAELVRDFGLSSEGPRCVHGFVPPSDAVIVRLRAELAGRPDYEATLPAEPRAAADGEVGRAEGAPSRRRS